MVQEQLKRFPLGKDIFLNVVENDRHKTNYITVNFVTPLNPRCASFNTLLSRVLARGCEKYPTQKELNRALDTCFDAALTSDTAKIGEWHSLSLSLSLLDNAYAFDGEDIGKIGLALLEEVLFHPYLPEGVFSRDYVKSEKKLALLEIASMVNHKARYAKGRLIDHMCRLEPYSTCAIGRKRELNQITPEALYAYYKELLKTARVEIFLVGRFDLAEAQEKMTAMFAAVEREPVALPELSIRTKARSVKEVTEVMDISQANLLLGFRTATAIFDADWRAMSVYNAVLGGSLTSKLFCVLREKMSLCYSVSSSPDALKGILIIYAGIAAENRDVAVKEVLNQMDEIKKGNVTAEEMENARGALIHSLTGLPDNPAALADWYLPRVLAGKTETPSQIVSELQAVTVEDVIRVSQKLSLDTVYTLTGKEEA